MKITVLGWALGQLWLFRRTMQSMDMTYRAGTGATTLLRRVNLIDRWFLFRRIADGKRPGAKANRGRCCVAGGTPGRPLHANRQRAGRAKARLASIWAGLHHLRAAAIC